MRSMGRLAVVLSVLCVLSACAGHAPRAQLSAQEPRSQQHYSTSKRIVFASVVAALQAQGFNPHRVEYFNGKIQAEKPADRHHAARSATAYVDAIGANTTRVRVVLQALAPASAPQGEAAHYNALLAEIESAVERREQLRAAYRNRAFNALPYGGVIALKACPVERTA